MKVIVAESAGFCFGVERAVKMTNETADSSDRIIYTYGPIIHNDHVVKELEKKNIFAFDPDDDNSKLSGHTVVVRSHGVSEEEYNSIKENASELVDATCPFVKKIHRIVREHSAAGDVIVVVGAAEHPEVKGITGWSETECTVVECEEEASALELARDKKICVVSQTTFNKNKFQDIVEIIRKKGYDVKAFNTICNATEERQQEAVRIASESDVMLVVGGKNSSNSRKLYQLCRELCPRTFFLQSAEGLDLSAFHRNDRVGITAGASTPNIIIQEVLRKCQTKQ